MVAKGFMLGPGKNQNGDNISAGRELKNGRDASTLSEGKFMSPKGKLLDPSKEGGGRRH